MKQKEINIQCPQLSNAETVASTIIDKVYITDNTEVTIQDAFKVIDESLFLFIENVGHDSILTIKAGGAYPNSLLGDKVILVPSGLFCLRLNDLTRFQRPDYSLIIEFPDKFIGNLVCVAKGIL